MDRILDVQTPTVTSTAVQVDVPSPKNSAPEGSGNPWAELQYNDSIYYVFDDFSGSFTLMQESGDTQGIKIYDTILPVWSGPWRNRMPPTWLYNSGSNSQAVTVTLVLQR